MYLVNLQIEVNSWFKHQVDKIREKASLLNDVGDGSYRNPLHTCSDLFSTHHKKHIEVEDDKEGIL